MVYDALFKLYSDNAWHLERQKENPSNAIENEADRPSDIANGL